YRDVPASIKTDRIRSVAESFVANIDRVRFLAELPTTVSSFSVTVIAKSFNEIIKYYKEDAKNQIVKFLSGESNEISENDVLKENIIKSIKDRSWMSKTWPDGDVNPLENYSIAISSMLPIIIGDSASKGFQSLFSALILGTWTAFETLAGD